MFYPPPQQNKVPINRYQLRDLIKRMHEKTGMVNFRSVAGPHPGRSSVLHKAPWLDSPELQGPPYPHFIRSDLPRLAHPAQRATFTLVPKAGPAVYLLLIFQSNLHIATSIIIFKHRATQNILEFPVFHRIKSIFPCMSCTDL